MNKFLCFLLLIALAGLGMLVGSSCESLQQEAKPGQEKPSAMPVERAVTIVVVYDNYQVNSNLSPAWGFGCVIRTPTQDILFDTGGDSSILLSNMEKMNIDPKDIDIVVISHIHGDHVGGLTFNYSPLIFPLYYIPGVSSVQGVFILEVNIRHWSPGFRVYPL